MTSKKVLHLRAIFDAFLCESLAHGFCPVDLILHQNTRLTLLICPLYELYNSGHSYMHHMVGSQVIFTRLFKRLGPGVFCSFERNEYFYSDIYNNNIFMIILLFLLYF